MKKQPIVSFLVLIGCMFLISCGAISSQKATNEALPQSIETEITVNHNDTESEDEDTSSGVTIIYGEIIDDTENL